MTTKEKEMVIIHSEHYRNTHIYYVKSKENAHPKDIVEFVRKPGWHIYDLDIKELNETEWSVMIAYD